MEDPHPVDYAPDVDVMHDKSSVQSQTISGTLRVSQVVVGFVVGLGYSNPYLSPFEEFQRYKTHPSIRAFLEGGKRISYGARAITAGGLMSLPKLVFPGGALVGDDAGFLNPSRIKGSHAAIKTGKLAAKAAFDAVQAGRQNDELTAYPASFDSSWLKTELYRARRPDPEHRLGDAGRRRRAQLSEHVTK
jgi:flavin-dependent dehydrogenase